MPEPMITDGRLPTTLSHKIRLDPTPQQRLYLRRACGVARFVWNWALERWRQEYEAGGKPSGMGLKKQFNAIKGEEFPWVYEVTKYAAQQPFLHLQTAFRNFFANRARYPRFKRRKCANLSWELKRLQTPWFDGVGQNKIKPRRKEPRWEVCYVRSRNARSRVVWVRSRW